MPRPRFHKLSEEKRKGILDVATEEFAEHGFEGASYNRIIERAGLSKGAMYYYFDDKMDLYGTVLQAALQWVLGELRHPDQPTVEEFWRGLELEYSRFGELVMMQPHLTALMHGLMDHPDRRREGPIAEMFDAFRAYTHSIVDHGQRIGAVRTDLDHSLLVAVTFAVGEAMDRWGFANVEALLQQPPDLMPRQLVGLYRRLLEPRGEEP